MPFLLASMICFRIDLPANNLAVYLQSHVAITQESVSNILDENKARCEMLRPC